MWISRKAIVAIHNVILHCSIDYGKSKRFAFGVLRGCVDVKLTITPGDFNSFILFMNVKLIG